MNLGQLREKLLFIVDDLNAGYFTNPQTTVFLNNALYEVQKYLNQANENYHLNCVQTNTVQYQPDYVLPADFMKVNRLEIVYAAGTANETTYPLTSITLNQQDMLPNGPGQPCSYFLRKNRLILVPRPDNVYTLRLTYTYKVADMVIDADIPDIPEQYHEMICILAGIDCFIKDARDASLLIKKKEFYETMLKQDADERTIDSPRMIVDVESGYYGGFY